MSILRIKKTASTNDYIKKFIKKCKDVTVVSQIQLAGKGTNGRSFSSEEGGIYLSHLKFYNSLDAENAFSIIENISVAVVKTLLAFNIKPQIKWPNDILVNGKKICGILVENHIEHTKIKYSVIGIGLNVLNAVPKELEDIATSIENEVGAVNFEAVLQTLLFNLNMKAEVGLYARYSCVLNKEVCITEGKNCYSAVVLEILNDGRIKLDNGKILAAAEIKLKV